MWAASLTLLHSQHPEAPPHLPQNLRLVTLRCQEATRTPSKGLH